MGRHSAPDEDDAPLDERGTSPVALRERDTPDSAPGRHYRGDEPTGADVDKAPASRPSPGADPAEAETGRIPTITAPLADDPPAAGIETRDAAAPGTADTVTDVTLDELIGAPPDRVDDVTERIPPVVDDRPRPPASSAPVLAQPVLTQPMPAPPAPAPRPADAPVAGPAATGHPTPQPAGTAAKRPAAPHVAVKHAAHNSAADLHLVRSSRVVLVLCVLAVLVPFAIDVVVLTVLGDLTLRRFLVWMWAPLIAAGVLVGAVLDAGHRRHQPG